MQYSEKSRDYSIKYAKENLKRVPLDIQKPTYEKIKAFAEAHGETVNGFIKRAIDEAMERDNSAQSATE